MKPLDDIYDGMDMTFIRYQDDGLMLCKSKRQMNRCWRRMMQVLQERRLGLSRKKTRRGPIEKGFHFLGIDYLPTQPEDNTTELHAIDEVKAPAVSDHKMIRGG